MMPILAFLLMVHVSEQAVTQTGCCRYPRYIIHNLLSGKFHSVLEDHQIGALKLEFQTSMNVFKKQMKSDLERIGRMRKSVVYTRWGKKSCPSYTELVLSGFTGGSRHTHSGAAAEPLCLPRDPEWGWYTDRTDGAKAYVYGAEYETQTSTRNLHSVHNHDVPCAVCLVHNRSVVRVFPARKTCYRGWKLEYDGYLMAGYHGHYAATSYTCIDRNPDTIMGGHFNHDGYLFYSVEARCGSLRCPPYVN